MPVQTRLAGGGVLDDEDVVGRELVFERDAATLANAGFLLVAFSSTPLHSFPPPPICELGCPTRVEGNGWKRKKSYGKKNAQTHLHAMRCRGGHIIIISEKKKTLSCQAPTMCANVWLRMSQDSGRTRQGISVVAYAECRLVDHPYLAAWSSTEGSFIIEIATLCFFFTTYQQQPKKKKKKKKALFCEAGAVRACRASVRL